MAEKKIGRPSKLCPEKMKAICASIEEGNTMEAAAGAGGINKSTLYLWINQGKEQKKGQFKDFLDALVVSRCKAETLLVGFLHKKAKGGCAKSITFILQRQFGWFADGVNTGPPPTPPKPTEPKTILELLYSEVEQLSQSIVKAEEVGSWQAVGQFRKQRMTAAFSIRRVEKEDGTTRGEFDGITDRGLMLDMVGEVEDWPPVLKQEFIDMLNRKEKPTTEDIGM